MYFTISVFDALFGVVCALMLIFGGKLVYICMLYNVYTVCKIRINNWVYFTFFLTGSIRQVIIFCSSELLVKNLHRESASLICINNFEKYTVPEIISISVLQPSLSGLEQMQLITYHMYIVYCLHIVGRCICSNRDRLGFRAENQIIFGTVYWYPIYTVHT